MENDSFQSKSCADQLKALSEPIRLRIIDILRHGEMTVGDIAEFLETELVTVSHHLKILRTAEILAAEKIGKEVYLRINKKMLEEALANVLDYVRDNA